MDGGGVHVARRDRDGKAVRAREIDAEAPLTREIGLETLDERRHRPARHEPESELTKKRHIAALAGGGRGRQRPHGKTGAGQVAREVARHLRKTGLWKIRA